MKSLELVKKPERLLDLEIEPMEIEPEGTKPGFSLVAWLTLFPLGAAALFLDWYVFPHYLMHAGITREIWWRAPLYVFLGYVAAVCWGTLGHITWCEDLEDKPWLKG